MANDFFLIQDVARPSGVTVRGRLILDAEVHYDDSPETEPEDPRLRVPKPEISELKWILPPEGSEAYDAAKRFAESMGLDTVDHEDFSYPGR